MTDHIVRRGECISSIAERYGLFWETVWDHPENEGLRTLRKDPNVLLEGDVVHVPRLTPKEEARPTDAAHRFKKKGVPAIFRLQLFDDDTPRKNQRFVLEVDGVTRDGTTDDEGVLEVPLSPVARRGHLVIGEDRARFELAFGELDPIDEIRGVQDRLSNLGFAAGTSGALDARTVRALRRFQARAGLEVSGALDDATRDALLAAHDHRGALPEPEDHGAPS